MKIINFTNIYVAISLIELLIAKVKGMVFDLHIMPTESSQSVRNLSQSSRPLYGNSSQLNYYYIDLYIGTPPVKQSLIIDTGSSITAIPCKELCSNCGNHLNPYYQLKNLSQIIQCNSALCTSVSSSCSRSNCTFTSSYSEGSSLSGIFIEEEISFGTDPAFPKKKLPIGCTMTESSIFYTQIADGIMGLSNNDKAFSSVMHRNGLIDRNLFSICLAENGGYFSLGEIKNDNHVNTIDYIPTAASGQFKVDLSAIRVNNQSYNISGEYSTSVDSGTTVTYFPQAVYDFIIVQLNAFCVNETLCSEKKQVKDLGQCFLIPNKALNDIIGYLPPLIFIFKNRVEYVLELKDSYFIESKSNTTTTLCLGYTHWGKNEILLGSTWMRNHDIIFDRDNQKVGMTRSNCSRSTSTSLVDYLEQPHKVLPPCEDPYHNIFSIVYVVLLCVIVFLSTSVYYIRRGKQFLCFKKKYNSGLPQRHQVLEDEIEKAIRVQSSA